LSSPFPKDNSTIFLPTTQPAAPTQTPRILEPVVRNRQEVEAAKAAGLFDEKPCPTLNGPAKWEIEQVPLNELLAQARKKRQESV
jgi:hypothetical protein